jgi:hypothetical protein
MKKPRQRKFAGASDSKGLLAQSEQVTVGDGQGADLRRPLPPHLLNIW